MSDAHRRILDEYEREMIEFWGLGPRTGFDELAEVCPAASHLHAVGRNQLDAEAQRYRSTTLQRVDGCTQDTASVVAGAWRVTTILHLGKEPEAMPDALDSVARLLGIEARALGALRSPGCASMVRSIRRARDVLRANAAVWRQQHAEDLAIANAAALGGPLAYRDASKEPS